MLLQLIMLFLQLVSLLIITGDVPVFYIKYCRKRENIWVLLIKIRNWNEAFFFIWSEIEYDINSKISFKKYLYF
jgi:hypothetical protein